MAALLANPAVLAALGAAAVPVGGAIGSIAGKGISKLGKLFGLKKGGSLTPAQMTKALNQATVKKTGIRKVKPHELVIPAKLATQLKAVAKRKPQAVKRKKAPKKKGGKKKK
jgi:hypothetical protein|tara:strand:+ start:713 stop:1048 length:336 start_codon:yes stop_codon:yes gene_type:complete